MATHKKIFGDGLIPVTDQVIIARYNACLDEIGIKKTALTAFHIDGIGWSPEIAAELGNERYLSPGPSDTFWIILTPEQYGKPIYHPSYSFDKDILNNLFYRSRYEIADITSQTAIWLDIDDGIADYRRPVDLLLLKKVMIKPNVIGNLSKIAEEENRLVHEFMAGDNWDDDYLRAKIQVRGKAYGDLRKRNVVLQQLHFEHVQSYRTSAFGGTFVFRNLVSRQYLIVMESRERYEKIRGEIPDIYSIDDNELPGILESEGLALIDWNAYRKQPELLRNRCDDMIAHTAFAEIGDIDFVGMNETKRRRFIQSLDSKGKLPEACRRMETFLSSLEDEGGLCPYDGPMKPSMKKALLLPNPELAIPYREVVAHLLAKMSPFAPLSLYTYDTNELKRRYDTWSAAKQLYVANVIERHSRTRKQ